MSHPATPETAPQIEDRPTTERRPLGLRTVVGLAIGVLGLTILVLLGEELRSRWTPTTPGAASPSSAALDPAAPAFAALTSRSVARTGSPAASAPGGPVPPSAAHAPVGGESPGIRNLRERAAADPDDSAARRELALALLEEEHWVEAYRTAEEILADDASAPDAIFVRSVVRMRMGQNEGALRDLESLVRKHPDHVEGHRALGLAYLRIGRAEDAVSSWERGLTAAGGSHGELERLLNVSRAARSERESAG